MTLRHYLERGSGKDLGEKQPWVLSQHVSGRNKEIEKHNRKKKQQVKVKCTLVQAVRLCTVRTAHRGSRGIAQFFMTPALEGDEGSASRHGPSLPPGKTQYPLYRRLGEPQGRSGQVQKIPPPPGFDPRTFQPVTSHYTDYATRPTKTADDVDI